MPKDKQRKQYSIDTLRHAEYYGMQGVFDDLYARSRKGEVFTNISDIILSRNNILCLSACISKPQNIWKVPRMVRSVW